MIYEAVVRVVTEDGGVQPSLEDLKSYLEEMVSLDLEEDEDTEEMPIVAAIEIDWETLHETGR